MPLLELVFPARWAADSAEPVRHRKLQIAVIAAAILVCGVQAFALRGDLFLADAISYFFYFLSLMMCAAACVPFARREAGTMRLRWILFAVACVLHAMNFLLAAAQHFHLTDSFNGQLRGAVLNAFGNSLVLIAATLAFSGASRPMTVLDALQGLLFGAISFCLVFNPQRGDFFTENHLLTATLVTSFLFLITFTAFAGADSRHEARFLLLLTVFFGFQVIAVICMNQIAIFVARDQWGSIWDVPETLLNFVFLYLMVWVFDRPAPRLSEQRPTIYVRNLMPSLLALGNIVLALALLSTYKQVSLALVIGTFVSYALRTTMLQNQTGNAHASLHAINQELELLATRDSLTGAGNRRSLAAALQRLSLRDCGNIALLLVDSDNFKQANDSKGHLYGDQVLVRLADVLSDAVRMLPDSHCARFGGDEFALLLPGFDSEAAAKFGEGLRVAVQELALDAGDGVITISVGGVAGPLRADLTFEQLVSRADHALYRAKSLGRNRVAMTA